MNSRKKVAIWLVWLFIWPISLYILYLILDPVFNGNKLDILAFVILASIVALFPLQVGDNPVFFTHGIAFAVFLRYGLFVELLVSQSALIFLLIKLRVGKASLHRIPLNFVMFLVISVSSAGVYYMLGGVHGAGNVARIDNIIPILGYAISQIFFNQLSIKLISRWLYRKQMKMFDRGFIWDIFTASLVLPIGYILYMVFIEVGVSAVLFVGIPFVFLSGMFMLYHNSNQINTYLKETSKIGHELTGKLGVTDVLDLFIDRISKMLPLDYIYVFDVNKKSRMELIRYFDRTEEFKFPETQLRKGEGISGHTWQERKSFHYHKQREWIKYKGEHTPVQADSVISIPIERNHEIVGILTVFSNQKRAFMQYQFMILEILANYLGVAIENARHYERTKEESERCSLTGLYNFRYFEDQLHHVFEKSQKESQVEPISLILLDIDHFKQVNDNFGHESGNEILCQLADRLTGVIDEHGIVARYGGEEFVVLLPGYFHFEAFALAEKVRRVIIGQTFSSYYHILNGAETIDVPITASIGVATYPNDCEEPLELIRHADRAMYVGAKKRGRDRVASYESLKTAAE